MPRLRRADCSSPGITRRKRGRGFEYLDANGRPVKAGKDLARIRDLVIPPAWTDVWICPDPLGHLQAVGTDAAGRKQYLYHPAWRTRRDQEKFDHMLDFAKALPAIRKTYRKHLKSKGLNKDRVLACAVRLLDIGFFRIGTEGYADDNQSYGLATMRRNHVTVKNGVITFDYMSKSRKRRVLSVGDPQVRDIVVQLKRRRTGRELLAYQSNGEWRDVKSADINEYIKSITDHEFTAKDFRTWSATVLAAVGIATYGRAATSKTARHRAIVRTVQDVAHYLGNTPAVCRASYIDPRVFDRFRSGWIIEVEPLGDVDEIGQPAFHGAIEEAVIDLLEERTRSDGVEKVEKAA
ncbi:MAG TPA: DNA topoisomerase IB [Actinomycetota bacterium]|nr:DNA topoisomerase IB [Actinomycetota bacterium]